MNNTELKMILDNHKLWLENLSGGIRADLRGADLRGADLRGTNLSEADLRGANLIRANLIRADLRGADLRGTNLRGTNLSEADLRGANLIRADLSEADLSGANLIRADLSDIKSNYLTINYTIACPEEGSFIAYKNAIYNGDYVIVKLQITETALRSSATTSKCRASEAVVLEISTLKGEILDNKTLNNNLIIHSKYDKNFTYKVGDILKPTEEFDTNRWNECSTGIHFFMNRKNAVTYES